MNNTGQIGIHIDGKYGNDPISPDNFDISLVHELLGYVCDLLKTEKKTETPTTLSIEKGSVRTVFTTSKEIAAKFSVIVSMLTSSYTLEQFEPRTSQALESMQKFAIKNGISLDLSTSESNNTISITPNTKLFRSWEQWVDAEIYLYGRIIDAGGKNKGNIHLDTGEGILTIEADKIFLGDIKENPLYKKYGVRATAKQHIATGVIDKASLKLIEIIDYNPVFNIDYLNKKRALAAESWKGVDADIYVHQIREGIYGL